MTRIERNINNLFMIARDREPVFKARIASALVYKNKIISYGFNQNRTAWMQRKFKKEPNSHYIHAEVDAIRNAMRIVDFDTIAKSTLYIARAKIKNNNFSYGLVEPCSGCKECINFFNIRNVYYTTDENEIKKLEFNCE